MRHYRRFRRRSYGRDKASAKRAKFGSYRWFWSKFGHKFKGYKTPARRAQAISLAYKKWKNKAESFNYMAAQEAAKKRGKSGKKSGKAPSAKQKAGRETFRLKMDGILAGIRGIAPSQRKRSGGKKRARRPLTDSQKLRRAEATLKAADKELKLAADRVKKERSKAKTKAEKKVHNKSAAKIKSASAKVASAGKKAKGLADKILEGKVDPKHFADIKAAIDLQMEEIERQAKIAKKAAEESSKAAAQRTPGGMGSGFANPASGWSQTSFFGMDPRRRGKKSKAKKSKAKKSKAKKSKAKKSGKRRGPPRSYWALYKSRKNPGTTRKSKHRWAKAQYAKKHGRDYGALPASALFFA